MRVIYDDEADALYIGLSDAVVSRSVDYDRGTIVDVDASETIVGIEVIRPARSWPLDAIARDYRIDRADMEILSSMWGTSSVYPYAPSARRLVAS